MHRISSDKDYYADGKVVIDADGIPFEPASKDYVDQRVPIDSFTGTGSPEGRIAAPVGTIYTDTAATNGAIRWVKTQGTGNTGWQVEYGDTGWRVLPHHSANSGLTGQGRILMRRQGNLVTSYFDSIGVTEGSGAALVLHTNRIPAGFRAANNIGTIFTVSASNGSYDYADLRFNTSLWFLSRRKAGVYSTDRTGLVLNGEVSWTTNDPWPTSLPGTPL